MAKTTQRGQTPPKDLDSLHGDLAFWFFAVAELVTIGIGLIVFAISQKRAPEQALQLHDLLHRNLALANTIILLTSGALLAIAVHREEIKVSATKLWGIALFIGSAFLAVKGYEFYAMAEAGLSLSSGQLISGYFLLTGFHFLHVGLGIIFVASIFWKRLRTTSVSEEERLFGGSAAIFWHSLDLMWIAIFAVVYS